MKKGKLDPCRLLDMPVTVLATIPALGWEERDLSDQIDKGRKQFLSDPLFSAEHPHKCTKGTR